VQYVAPPKEKEREEKRKQERIQKENKKRSWPRRKLKRKPGKYHTKRNSQNVKDQSL